MIIRFIAAVLTTAVTLALKYTDDTIIPIAADTD